MPVEIERKFLLHSEDWRAMVSHSCRLTDGLVAAAPDGRKVRVRIAGDLATLTVKGTRRGLTRDEFEYPIPLEDARQLLADHCAGLVIEKTRHYVPQGGVTWEIDCYHGALEGIVVAEVELRSIDQTFDRPAWLGEEVTGREEWRKINLIRARMALA
jgi:adenylate cyclase